MPMYNVHMQPFMSYRYIYVSITPFSCVYFLGSLKLDFLSQVWQGVLVLIHAPAWGYPYLHTCICGWLLLPRGRANWIPSFWNTNCLLYSLFLVVFISCGFFGASCASPVHSLPMYYSWYSVIDHRICLGCVFLVLGPTLFHYCLSVPDVSAVPLWFFKNNFWGIW